MRRLQTDFKTVADFGQATAVRLGRCSAASFRHELDLYGRELVAVDGTRTKALNSRERNFTRENPNPRLQKVDKRLEHYLNEMDEADAQDAGSSTVSTTDLEAKIESLRKGPATLQAHGKTLKQRGESQLPLTDPDAWAMEARTERTRSQCGNCRQGPSAEGSSSDRCFFV